MNNVARITRPENLNGEAGLLAAVIAQATKDAIEGRGAWRADAWAYFAGDVYEEHVELLGLAPDVLPAPIMELAHEGRS